MALTPEQIEQLERMKICQSCEYFVERRLCEIYQVKYAPPIGVNGTWPTHCQYYDRVDSLPPLTQEELDWIHETTKTIETLGPVPEWVTKIIAGSGISISSTGPIPGTGEVTINSTGTAVIPRFYQETEPVLGVGVDIAIWEKPSTDQSYLIWKDTSGDQKIVELSD